MLPNHAADAVQTYCIFVLRSYRITVAPLIIYSVLLWGAGLGGGYWLAYAAPAGLDLAAITANTPAPFWAASAAALWLTAILFGTLLRWAVRQVD